MNRLNCPGSGQPVTQGARVIVTRLRHEQRIGRCAGCQQFVLTRDGLAIEHLVKEVHADELGTGRNLSQMAASVAPASANGSERTTAAESNPTRPRPSQGRAQDASAAAPTIVDRRTLRERLKGRVQS